MVATLLQIFKQLLPALLAGSLLVHPVLAASNSSSTCSSAVTVTVEQLQRISDRVVSNAATCKKVAKAFSSDTDCSTAADAAKGITAAFNAYKVVSLNHAAASVANMITQSDGFRFNHNRWTTQCAQGCAVPGAGTKAMLQANWILQYILASGDTKLVSASTAIKAAWKDCKGKLDCTGTDAETEQNLALVNGSDHTYATSPWFLMQGHTIDSSCSATLLDDLNEGKTDTYQQCLGTAMEIADVFTKARSVLTCDGSTDTSERSSGDALIAFESKFIQVVSGNQANFFLAGAASDSASSLSVSDSASSSASASASDPTSASDDSDSGNASETSFSGDSASASASETGNSTDSSSSALLLGVSSFAAFAPLAIAFASL